MVESRRLRDLVDLALCTPEVGAVNFNILRTLLLNMLDYTGIGDAVVSEMPQMDQAPSLQFISTPNSRNELAEKIEKIESFLECAFRPKDEVEIKASAPPESESEVEVDAAKPDVNTDTDDSCPSSESVTSPVQVDIRPGHLVYQRYRPSRIPRPIQSRHQRPCDSYMKILAREQQANEQASVSSISQQQQQQQTIQQQQPQQQQQQPEGEGAQDIASVTSYFDRYYDKNHVPRTGHAGSQAQQMDEQSQASMSTSPNQQSTETGSQFDQSLHRQQSQQSQTPQSQQQNRSQQSQQQQPTQFHSSQTAPSTHQLPPRERTPEPDRSSQQPIHPTTHQLPPRERTPEPDRSSQQPIHPTTHQLPPRERTPDRSGHDQSQSQYPDDVQESQSQMDSASLSSLRQPYNQEDESFGSQVSQRESGSTIRPSDSQSSYGGESQIAHASQSQPSMSSSQYSSSHRPHTTLSQLNNSSGGQSQSQFSQDSNFPPSESQSQDQMYDDSQSQRSQRSFGGETRVIHPPRSHQQQYQQQHQGQPGQQYQGSQVRPSQSSEGSAAGRVPSYASSLESTRAQPSLSQPEFPTEYSQSKQSRSHQQPETTSLFDKLDDASETSSISQTDSIRGMSQRSQLISRSVTSVVSIETQTIESQRHMDLKKMESTQALKDRIQKLENIKKPPLAPPCYDQELPNRVNTLNNRINMLEDSLKNLVEINQEMSADLHMVNAELMKQEMTNTTYETKIEEVFADLENEGQKIHQLDDKMMEEICHVHDPHLVKPCPLHQQQPEDSQAYPGQEGGPQRPFSSGGDRPESSDASRPIQSGSEISPQTHQLPPRERTPTPLSHLRPGSRPGSRPSTEPSTSSEKTVPKSEVSNIPHLEDLKKEIEESKHVPEIFDEMDVLLKIATLWEAFQALRNNEENLAIQLIGLDAKQNKLARNMLEALDESKKNLAPLISQLSLPPHEYRGSTSYDQDNPPRTDQFVLADDVKNALANMCDESVDAKHQMEALGEAVRNYEALSVTKEMMADAIKEKADLEDLKLKVSYDEFGNSINEITQRMQGLVGETYQKNKALNDVIAQITEEMSQKLDKCELTPLRRFIKTNFKELEDKVNKLQRMIDEPDPCGTRKKFLKDYNCISCDRYTAISGVTNTSTLPVFPPATNRCCSAAPNVAYDVHRMRNKHCGNGDSTLNFNLLEKQIGGTGRFGNSGNQTYQNDIANLVNRYSGGSHTNISQSDRIRAMQKPPTDTECFNTDDYLKEQQQMQEKINFQKQTLQVQSVPVYTPLPQRPATAIPQSFHYNAQSQYPN